MLVKNYTKFGDVTKPKLEAKFWYSTENNLWMFNLFLESYKFQDIIIAFSVNMDSYFSSHFALWH